MQLSCFRSVAHSAKQLPSDWEEPAPEVATSNRRYTGSTQKVQCTEYTYREDIEGAVHTQGVQCTHKECTVHGEGHTGGKSGTLERRHCDVWS